MSGRINITVPEAVHLGLRVYCVTNSKTMAEVVADALRHYLSAEEARHAKRTT